MGEICELGQWLALETTQMYDKILDKLGTKMSEKFLKDADQETRDAFVERLKGSQKEKLTQRLTLIMNRILADHYFLNFHDKMMSQHKSIGELKQDNEIANNHLQSVENERSILQRDFDLAIERVESVCEAIL